MSGDFSFIDLTRSPEEITRAHQERLAKLQELHDGAAAEGVAASDNERIKATFSETEGLRELVLDPRALRLPSDELASEIVRLVNQARDEAQHKVRALADESTGEGLADPNTVLEQLPDVERSVDGLMRDTQEITHQLMNLVARMTGGTSPADSMPADSASEERSESGR